MAAETADAQPRPPAGGSPVARSSPQLRPWLLAALGGSVVALAATGSGLLVPPVDSGEAWTRGIRVAGALAACLGAAGLLLERRRIRDAGEGGGDPTLTGLRTAATLMGVLFLVGLLSPQATPTDPSAPGGAPGSAERFRMGEGSGGESMPSTTRGSGSSPVTSSPSGEGESGPAPPPGATTGPDSIRSLLRRAAGFLPWLLLAAVAVLALRHLRRALDRPPEEPLEVEPPLPPLDRPPTLSEVLAELARVRGDPRREVLTAYRALLAALAGVGARRRPEEAPHEHLRRALTPAHAAAGPAGRLATLYVGARYSGRPVDPGQGSEALQALEEGLAALEGGGGGPAHGTEPGGPGGRP